MKSLKNKLSADYPQFTFVSDDVFYWSPKYSQIHYANMPQHKQEGSWKLLHELAHAVLGHATYNSDIELIELEAMAWNKAQELARDYSSKIPEDYIQDCMDTYRDWLHLRSKCPECGSVSPQLDSSHYRCFNCLQEWTVSSSRFCRPYRRKSNKKTTPANKSQALFS